MADNESETVTTEPVTTSPTSTNQAPQRKPNSVQSQEVHVQTTCKKKDSPSEKSMEFERQCTTGTKNQSMRTAEHKDVVSAGKSFEQVTEEASEDKSVGSDQKHSVTDSNEDYDIFKIDDLPPVVHNAMETETVYESQPGSDMYNSAIDREQWVFHPLPSDSPEIKDAARIAAEELEWTLNPSSEVNCVLDEQQFDGERFRIQRLNAKISLPNQYICIDETPEPLIINAENMRYVTVYTEEDDNSVEKYILYLSFRHGNGLQYIKFSFAEVKESLYYLNLFRYCMNFYYGGALLRTLHDFRPLVRLCECTANISTTKSNASVATNNCEEESISNCENTTQKDDKYWCTLDIESLCLFHKIHSRKPAHELFFYKEKGGVNVVEKISVKAGSVFLISEHLTVELPAVQKEIPAMISCLKRIKPQHEEWFRDRYIEADMDSGVGDSDLKRYPFTPPSEVYREKPLKSEHKLLLNKSTSKEDGQEDEQFQATPQSNDEIIENKERILVFTDQLERTLEFYELVGEPFPSMWESAQRTMEQMIEVGFVPEIDIRSGGINPDSVDHLAQYFQEIEEELMSENFGSAISKTRGLQTLFSESTYHEVREITREDELVLMKKIFFRPMTQQFYN